MNVTVVNISGNALQNKNGGNNWIFLSIIMYHYYYRQHHHHNYHDSANPLDYSFTHIYLHKKINAFWLGRRKRKKMLIIIFIIRHRPFWSAKREEITEHYFPPSL